jgi:hypothetical protein
LFIGGDRLKLTSVVLVALLIYFDTNQPFVITANKAVLYDYQRKLTTLDAHDSTISGHVVAQRERRHAHGIRRQVYLFEQMAAVFRVKSACNRPAVTAGVCYTDGVPMFTVCFLVSHAMRHTDLDTIKRKHNDHKAKWVHCLHQAETLCEGIIKSHQARPYHMIDPHGVCVLTSRIRWCVPPPLTDAADRSGKRRRQSTAGEQLATTD